MPFALQVDREIELQLLEDVHVDALYRLVDDARDHLEPRLEWVDATTSPDDLRQFVEQSREFWADRAGVHTAIVRGDTLCGAVGMNAVDDAGDLTFWLHPDRQGRGIATRAARRLLSYGFEHLEIRRCIARLEPDNVPARGVVERLGFRRDALLRNAGRRRGGLHDVAIWSLLRSEWSSESG